jgi:hypothetical protein
VSKKTSLLHSEKWSNRFISLYFYFLLLQSVIYLASTCVKTQDSLPGGTMYEGESVYRSQMDIKRKTCDIQIWKKKYLFFDISTNINTLVPSLYQCVETHSKEVFWLLSQPLPQLRSNLLVNSETSSTEVFFFSGPKRWKSLGPTINRKYFYMNTLLHWVFLPTEKLTAERCSSVVQSSSTVTILTTETSLWTLARASATYTVMKLDCAAT